MTLSFWCNSRFVMLIPDLDAVFPVSKMCVVAVFMCNRIVADFLWSLIQSAEVFFYKGFASLITDRTGSGLYPIEDNLAAGIGLFTMVPMDAEMLLVTRNIFTHNVLPPTAVKRRDNHNISV